MPLEHRSPQLVVARLLDEPLLDEDIRAVGTLTPPRDAVLDFAAVTYLASVHLAMLLTLRKHLHAHDRRLRLCNMRANVRELFKITSLELVLEISEDEADAVASLG